ncbi:acyl-CoA N-acyltransferase [Lactarius akahatsu]|uniref:Acyl-CoA N-acyltransferase n=1 Tax=Lactarius akahatsu TaxID=416441 RepID=A0AAD4Q345_9AGAM|nr:acyl-CoA N-acyltransferase [Lactarius akahatsu]
MAYINSYEKPERSTLLPGYFGPDPYDINWAFPLYEETLESERVTLTPFIPSLHAQEYAAQVGVRPELHRWFPLDLSSLDLLLTEVEVRVRRNPSWILFAIIDKARGGAMAGVIGLINASPENLSAEIAWVLVFPAFQGTYVTSNAIGIMLQYAFELPSPGPGGRRGLGFRRVQWTAHSANKPSHAAATRMGLKEEGVLHWSWVLHEGAEGHGIPLRTGDPLSPRPGRHSVLFALCADDWENGGREHVQRLIDRK